MGAAGGDDAAGADSVGGAAAGGRSEAGGSIAATLGLGGGGGGGGAIGWASGIAPLTAILPAIGAASSVAPATLREAVDIRPKAKPPPAHNVRIRATKTRMDLDMPPMVQG